MKQSHMSRAGRKAQIVMGLFDRMIGSPLGQMTSYAIAREIGLAPSTHVKKMLIELEQERWVIGREQCDLFGRTSTLYRLTVEAYDLMLDTYGKYGDTFVFVKSWFES